MAHHRATFATLLAPVAALALAAAGLSVYGIAAAIGALLGTAAVAFLRGQPKSTLVFGALGAAAGAACLHFFTREAVGAGLPAVRAFADGLWAAPLFALAVALLALRDHRRSS